ncbi:MAG: hypothetical protein OIF38_14705 [Cellvibrionaceae bacterium]|nr:hypothetical protein [Cellvibrionaceae bacterium]
MKKLLLTFFILCSSIVAAKDICPTNTDIPDDMRLPESHYSKENASIAIDFLSGVVKKDKSPGEWVNVPNALKTIDGYIRKKECIEHGKTIGGWKCSEFCSFMKSSFVYD